MKVQTCGIFELVNQTSWFFVHNELNALVYLNCYHSTQLLCRNHPNFIVRLMTIPLLTVRIQECNENLTHKTNRKNVNLTPNLKTLVRILTPAIEYQQKVFETCMSSLASLNCWIALNPLTTVDFPAERGVVRGLVGVRVSRV